VTVIFRWQGVDHIPLYEGNVFTESDTHWWGSRCGFTDRVVHAINELKVGMPTCLLCMHWMREYALKYGREPALGELRLVPLQSRLAELASRLELKHGQKESPRGSQDEDEAGRADQEHVVGSSTRCHRTY